MKRILFTWELGSGLGHLQSIKQQCELFKGHHLFSAVRELQYAEELLASEPITIIQAPHVAQKRAPDPRPAMCYADLLYNNGFSSMPLLLSLISEWQSLFDSIKPDIVFFYHSPSALLAAKSYSFSKVVSGSGFMCPPAEEPLGVFFPEFLSQIQSEQIKDHETEILALCNETQPGNTGVSLRNLADIYQADETLLTTLPMFDHFPREPGHSHYLGINPIPNGLSPKWPGNTGKRIFAYLKPFPKLESLLQWLKEAEQPTIIYYDSISEDILKRFRAPHIQFENTPLDIKEIANTSDFAILHGSHDTALQLLSLGLPIISIPLTRKQEILTKNLVATRACIAAYIYNMQQIQECLNELLTYTTYYQQKARQCSETILESTQEHVARSVTGILEKYL